MKQVIPRFIAVLLLVIPGLAATYGFLLMKDAAFHYFYSFGEEHVSINSNGGCSSAAFFYLLPA